MLGVVLGNGPSRKYYDKKGDYVLGCNIPGKEFRVDATVICDEEIVWVLKNNPNLIDVPIIVSSKVWEKMKELRIDSLFTIQRVFTTKDWYNTAHYATEFLVETGFNEINLWGCDSIFKNDISSTTDKYVYKEDTRGDRFTRQWRRIWNNIFDSHSNIKFNIMRGDQ